MHIKEKISNAALIPAIKPEETVALDDNGTPDWAGLFSRRYVLRPLPKREP